MIDAILSLDLGTSSIKGMLVAANGAVLTQARLPHATYRPSPGVAEQDPAEWWDHICRAITMLTTSAVEPVSIAAISVTGQMHGLVLRDDSGSPLRRAITWQDQRSTSTMQSLRARLPEHLWRDFDRTVAPGFLVASWHWITETHPDLANRTGLVSLPKDHIIYCLTGRHVTDPSDAVGMGLFDVTTGTWNHAIADAAGLPAALLPELVPSGAIAGTIRPKVASTLGLPTGIPVIVAGGDAAVGAFGAGVVQPNQELLMLSSGCQVIRPRNTMPVETTDGVLLWPSAAPAGLPPFLAVSTLLNGGDAIAWAQRLIPPNAGQPKATGDAQAVESPLFVPYLGGERSPVNAPIASGAFFGLDYRHTAYHLVHGAIDGVTLALLDQHLRMGGEIGNDAPIRIGGGGIRNQAWLDAIARLFARPLDVMDTDTLSGWGAARLAATSLGWLDPINVPDAWLPGSSRVTPCHPDPERSLARLDTFRQAARAVIDLATS